MSPAGGALDARWAGVCLVVPLTLAASHNPSAGPQPISWIQHGAEQELPEGTAGSQAKYRFMELISVTTSVKC